ncbi:Crp/Fnr family transcriptional regulator [Rhizobium sp. SSA_523]|uniref:Crp/Fnr family transcriptional regulator n=1 Tax=Rhizobium sp. SSA_523 TaxID=2952477 RepID=UPI0020901A72|nr:Crp/Fnr family transcriptional regulator [Rhizobium sp. SSA_523]MCO5734014.1 Crp/Fnr family transcriptional regulator [Rhizobium sp. SSA_523]WKC24656.1 Crp/Fnr family transcriptional regulator [Rhizobium sp. SSA_523]
MSAYQKSEIRNRLLYTLPEHEFEIIRPTLRPITLTKGFVIVEPDQPIDYVYFPFTGIGSVVTVSPEGHKAEAGMFGREGFSPTPAGVGGNVSIHEVIMQVEGEGVRIELDHLAELLKQCPVFANYLARFIQAFGSQISFTALSNAVHSIDERLARWLLMCHDRVDGDEIALTHEFISLMLAVRRPSVTTALHVLEGHKLIRAERGRITIRDRAALAAFAGDAYGKPEEEYRRLIGELWV